MIDLKKSRNLSRLVLAICRDRTQLNRHIMNWRFNFFDPIRINERHDRVPCLKSINETRHYFFSRFFYRESSRKTRRGDKPTRRKSRLARKWIGASGRPRRMLVNLANRQDIPLKIAGRRSQRVTAFNGSCCIYGVVARQRARRRLITGRS